MKRGNKGWPRRASDRHSTFNVAAIDRALTEAELCADCPPTGYPTDKTRCAPCPRRSDKSGDQETRQQ